MRFFHLVIGYWCLFAFMTFVSGENAVARKKGQHYYGLHGVIYKHGIMSFLAFLAVKAKIIIAVTVAFTVFMLGAKAWAAFRYGHLLFNKGCYHKHEEEVVVPHHPVYSHDHEYVGPIDIDGFKSTYAYEKFSKYK